jgi:hypothetical protein
MQIVIQPELQIELRGGSGLAVGLYHVESR